MRKVARRDQISIMLVDDHPAFRKGMAALIESQPDLKVIAEAGSGEEALELYRLKQPQVVLMDLRLPGMGGVEATMTICQEFEDPRIIILTTFDADEDIYRAIQAGARSYILKDTPERELWTMIRAIHDGEDVLPEKVATLLRDRQERTDLSSREMDVLTLLVKGRSNKEMSTALHVTEDTVKAHLKTLFVKLGVQDRTQAAVSAIRHGIVRLD